MSRDKDIIEFMQEKGIICPCITQNYTGPLYPGFVPNIYPAFLNIKCISVVSFIQEKDNSYTVVSYFFNDRTQIRLATGIETEQDAEIILHEIMRIITMG